MTYEETQKIKHLREVTSVMVENRTIDDCKNVTFEKVELSKIDFVKKGWRFLSNVI